jgi:glucosamine-6-phosphate deaminase
MKILIVKNYDEMGRKAAEIMAEEIKSRPNLVLGLATGSTPVGCYKELIKMNLDFSKITTFNLDEYAGLDEKHSQSYHYFMRKNLFDFINISQESIHIPDGMAKDVEKFSLEYDKAIKKSGGIGIQILGIGSNGHIAFNEPGTLFDSRTHPVKLKESTIADNSRFFKNEKDVPKSAVSMGMRTIFEAKKILLLASGKNKADAVAKTIEGPVTTDVPASILQNHNDAVIILDYAAASKLKKNY